MFRNPLTSWGAPRAQLAAAHVPATASEQPVAGSRGGRTDMRRSPGLNPLIARLRQRLLSDAPRRRGIALDGERMRIAGELHDLVMQDLALSLASARSVLADPRTRSREAGAAVAAGERALAGARQIVRELSHPRTEPLRPALDDCIRRAGRNHQILFVADIPDGLQIDAVTQDTLIHIAREAVTNAVKHAHAGGIEVRLEHDDEWQLSVSDDGRGFAHAVATPGFGLRSMRARAHAAGGSLTVTSRPGCGTTVQARLP
jgi:signal transduction histidine kinase